MFESMDHIEQGLTTSHPAPSAADTPPDPGKGGAVILTADMRAQGIARARSRIGEFLIRKYSINSPHRLSVAAGIGPTWTACMFGAAKDAPLAWALRAAIALPDLSRTLLALSVGEDYREDFLTGLSRLTDENLTIDEVNKRLVEEALACQEEENPYQAAKDEFFVKKKEPRFKLSDAWIWQRRNAFKLLLKKSGLSAAEFNEIVGFTPKDLRTFLSGDFNLLTEPVRELWDKSGRQDPTGLMFFGVPGSVAAQARIFKANYGIVISRPTIESRLQHAEKKIAAGEDPKGLSAMKLPTLVGEERQIDWEGAAAKVAEIGTRHSLLQALRRSDEDQIIKDDSKSTGEVSKQAYDLRRARVAAACSVAKAANTFQRTDLSVKLGISDTIFPNLVRCETSLSVDQALDLTVYYPQVSAVEILAFVWPSEREELKERLLELGCELNRGQSLKSQIEALASKVETDSMDHISEVHAANRLNVKTSAADIVKRGLFFIEVFDHFGTAHRKTIQAKLDLSRPVGRYISGEDHFSPTSVVEFFKRLPFRAYHYAPAFVSESQKALARKKLGELCETDAEKALERKAQKIAKHLDEDASEFKDFFETIARKTSIPRERITGRSLDLRTGVFNLKTQASEGELMFPDDWGVAEKALAAVRTGRFDLTLGQVFRIIESEKDIPAECFYFCLDQRKQALFAPLAEVLYGITIDETVIERVKSGVIPLENIQSVLLEEKELKAKLKRNPLAVVRDFSAQKIIDHLDLGYFNIYQVAQGEWNFNRPTLKAFRSQGWLSLDMALQAAGKRDSYPAIEYLCLLVNPPDLAEFLKQIKKRYDLRPSPESLKRVLEEAGIPMGNN